MDNDPEFISHKLDMWCREHKISLAFIQSGKPMQNGFVETCNGNIRKELLNAYVFTSLTEVREKAEEWRNDTTVQDHINRWALFRRLNLLIRFPC